MSGWQKSQPKYEAIASATLSATLRGSDIFFVLPRVQLLAQLHPGLVYYRPAGGRGSELDLLISYGCTINNHGKHLIHRTFMEMSTGNAKDAARMLQYLQTRGAHFKAITDWGATWIMECACADSHKGIEFLIPQGVDPSACIENRYIINGKYRAATIRDTALLMATRNKNVRSMNALIKGKADLNYIWKGGTVLDKAIKDKGTVSPPAATYKKELARLLKLSKTPKKTKAGIVTTHTYAKDFSVANLLKLAGAKTAAELSDSTSEHRDSAR